MRPSSPWARIIPAPWEVSINDCLQSLRKRKAIGDQFGITFCLELHVHSPFETIDQAKRFLEMMPEMPVVYDPTHFVMQGLDIRSTGWIMDRARHVRVATPPRVRFKNDRRRHGGF